MSHQSNNNNSESSGNEEKQSVRHCSRFVDQTVAKAAKVGELTAILPPVYGTTFETLKNKMNAPKKVVKIAPSKTFKDEFKITYLDSSDKKHHMRLYTALEKWGSVIFQLIMEYFAENGGKTNELFFDIQVYLEETVIQCDWVCLCFYFFFYV